MIKVAKRIILAILGNADISDEELLTAFTEAIFIKFKAINIPECRS